MLLALKSVYILTVVKYIYHILTRRSVWTCFKINVRLPVNGFGIEVCIYFNRLLNILTLFN